MFDFNKPNIEITDVSEDKKYGRFVVEPVSYTHLTLPTKA